MTTTRSDDGIDGKAETLEERDERLLRRIGTVEEPEWSEYGRDPRCRAWMAFLLIAWFFASCGIISGLVYYLVLKN